MANCTVVLIVGLTAWIVSFDVAMVLVIIANIITMFMVHEVGVTV